MAEFQPPAKAGLARFTSGGIAARQERLPGPLRELHRAVLRRFLEAGAPPTARWLRQAAADGGLDGAALDALAAADAVHVVNEVVAVAYPFSGTPTPHRVQLDGLPAVYAMCAIDALGLPLMAGRDGQVTSAGPHDGTPIEVTVRDGAWSWDPAGTVVVAGQAADCGAGCGSFEVMCPNTAFHASAGVRACLAGWPRRPGRGDPGPGHCRGVRPPQLRRPARRPGLTRRRARPGSHLARPRLPSRALGRGL
jgi:hypothetical protein